MRVASRSSAKWLKVRSTSGIDLRYQAGLRGEHHIVAQSNREVANGLCDMALASIPRARGGETGPLSAGTQHPATGLSVSDGNVLTF